MLYFDEYGDKKNPTILLLHGAAALDTFYNQYGLSQSYHLVVPHLSGAGKAAAEEYEPEKLRESLTELIEHIGKDKIGVIGHSLGAQLAIMLLCSQPEKFSFAVLLSAWVNPDAGSIKSYCKFSGAAAGLLHAGALVRLQGRYWHFSKERAAYMAEYSKRITPQVYSSFFLNTLDLDKLPEYSGVALPMLAICGEKELTDMKRSLEKLKKNPHCKTMILKKAGHDFPMRRADKLNIILESFIKENC